MFGRCALHRDEMGHRWRLLTNSGPAQCLPVKMCYLHLGLTRCYVPALTARLPSADVCAPLIYRVQSQRCIICVLRQEINASLHCGTKKVLFYSSQVKCTLPEK